MRLDRLTRQAGLAEAGLLRRVAGDASVEVLSVTMDSRAAAGGTLFACVPGSRHDGHAFAAEAVASGASALLCERELPLEVAQVVVGSVRAALGPVADVLAGHPSGHLAVVGVTGTNGKTTTVVLLRAVLEAAGWPASAIGTLTQARTTPEAPELQSRLAELRDRGFRAVAMEVSSHALAQHRVDGISFAAGVLTNVTRDHLDYHKSMEAYFEAKARLFEPGRVRVAVVNRADAWGRALLERLAAAGVPAVTFAPEDAREVELRPEGSSFAWHGRRIKLRLGGRLNVANAVAAAAAAEALGASLDAIAAGLSAVERVPGRFDAVDAGQPFTVLVDYAHTPDGLAQALRAAREITAGRLLVVFGAGGDRDQEKRPLMGATVAELADLAVVTSDNPRSEDPGAIIAEVLRGAAGAENVVSEPDRARAISAALASAAPGDLVLIAGKGHETGQEIGGRVLPFDDAGVAREALRRIRASRGEDRPEARPPIGERPGWADHGDPS